MYCAAVKRARRAILELLAIVVIALVISFVIKTFVVRSFYIPSASMETTLQPDDRVVVPSWTANASGVHRGDVVIFKDPGGWLPAAPVPPTAFASSLAFVGLAPPTGSFLIKRVIGLPGDVVDCCGEGGRLTVNGTPIYEPYITVPPGSPNADKYTYSVTVPAGMLWVLGDNRYDSADSAYHYTQKLGAAFVPETDVVGQASVIDWPITRWRSLSSYPEVFARVGKSTTGEVVPEG
jgi:signal peptidase I